jgi:hypothetical protein
VSAREYYQISQDEFEDAIGLRKGELVSGLAFLPCNSNGGRFEELVYDAIIDEQNSIRIYSSIIPGKGARDAGQDAIRVVRMFWTATGKIKPIGKEKRVNRIQNWRANLLARIAAVVSTNEIRCPRCGEPMKERRGPHGKFWGCIGYPSCCGTRKAER